MQALASFSRSAIRQKAAKEKEFPGRVQLRGADLVVRSPRMIADNIALNLLNVL